MSPHYWSDAVLYRKSGLVLQRGINSESNVHKRVNTRNVEVAFLMALCICNCYLKVFKGEYLQNYTKKSYGPCALHVD